ncbi:MAG: hypothetical protein ACI4KA_00110 [Oscillospiraceae bacterium]
MTEEAVSTNIGTVVENGIDTGFSMATKAFNWIVGNPLASFMLGLGFTYTAFSLIKRGIRTVKRI